MDLILKLPKALQSLSNQEVPSVVQERLHYLWNACNNLAIHSPALAHRMSRSFVQLSNKFDVDLPDYVACRLCRHCCAIQIPSETCTVRLRVRSRKSPARRDSSKPKNQIDGLSGKKRSFGDLQVNSMVSLSSTMSSPGPKFSFLNKTNTKSPAVTNGGHSFGSSKVDSLDFISFNSAGGKSNGNSQSGSLKNKSSNGLFTSQLLKSSSGSNLSALNTGGGNKGKSFSAGLGNSGNSGGLMGMAAKLTTQSNTSLSSMTSLFNMTNKLNVSGAPANNNNTNSSSNSGGGLNLLELERQNKKNKKMKK